MNIEGFLIPHGRDVSPDRLRDYAFVRSRARRRGTASALGNRLEFADCEAGEWHVAIFLEERSLWRSPRMLKTAGSERLTIELEAAAEYGSKAYSYVAILSGSN